LKRKRKQIKSSLVQDVFLIGVSIAVAVVLVKLNIVEQILFSTRQLTLLGSFIAGMFFTSIFTTAPSVVALGEIARANSLITTSAVGALGALVGDFVMFHFIRGRLSEHIMEYFEMSKGKKRLRSIFKLRIFRWVTPLIGALIIASPLPDELGIGLLGFSRMRLVWFLPLSFLCNFIGILLIGLVARSL
jgi:hypothetical protein